MSDPLSIAVLAVGVVALVVGVVLIVNNRRHQWQAKQLLDVAARLKEDAQREVETARREALIAVREEEQERRTELERELRDRKSKVDRLERRVMNKDEYLDRRSHQLEKREQEVEERVTEIERLRTRLDVLVAERRAELERLAGMTAEQAKVQLLLDIESEVRQDANRMVRAIEDEAARTAEARAINIIAQAIQRSAVEHVVESTVTVVQLPSDEMKGRIIGREGRNIRSFEQQTGVDLIIDDTPEAVVISTFDSVRREIARIALEQLILDGRIHPARIEQSVAKARETVEATMQEAGDEACLQAGIHDMHPDLVKTLGRLRFRTSYGQNVLAHSVEVSRVARILAAELGVNEEVARRAGLLHDIGKAADGDAEGSHTGIGIEQARRCGESPAVIHAIAAHHGDEEPNSVEAVLVQVSDAVSAARPGARRESLENYLKRLKHLEEIAQSCPGVDTCYAIQAGREIRVIVLPEQVDDLAATRLARDMAERIQAELEYPGQIKVTVIRETRSVEFAR